MCIRVCVRVRVRVCMYTRVHVSWDGSVWLPYTPVRYSEEMVGKQLGEGGERTGLGPERGRHLKIMTIHTVVSILAMAYCQQILSFP